MFFLEFCENFQNSFVKGQPYFHAVGTIKETDWLHKDLIRSALSLVIHNVRKFKIYELLLMCSIRDVLTLRKHPKLYYHYFAPDVSD